MPFGSSSKNTAFLENTKGFLSDFLFLVPMVLILERKDIFLIQDRAGNAVHTRNVKAQHHEPINYITHENFSEGGGIPQLVPGSGWQYNWLRKKRVNLNAITTGPKFIRIRVEFPKLLKNFHYSYSVFLPSEFPASTQQARGYRLVIDADTMKTEIQVNLPPGGTFSKDPDPKAEITRDGATEDHSNEIEISRNRKMLAWDIDNPPLNSACKLYWRWN